MKKHHVSLPQSECEAIFRRRKALKDCGNDDRRSWEMLKAMGYDRWGRPLPREINHG